MKEILLTEKEMVFLLLLYFHGIFFRVCSEALQRVARVYYILGFNLRGLLLGLPINKGFFFISPSLQSTYRFIGTKWLVKCILCRKDQINFS